ncbi:MAG TPA: ATP-binding protein [Acidobacteriota bacterium]|nr:ATP-binding protein [Acidobacteriota bacterium]
MSGRRVWQIHDMLSAGRAAVFQGVAQVTGAAGVGKTQLAIEYAHRFSGKYPGGIFWVDADRGCSALIDQVSEAAIIPIEGHLEESRRLEQLWLVLSQSQPCLIILDNFPPEGEFQPWLPVSGAIHTLVTTRRRDLTRYPALDLSVFDETDSLAVLCRGSSTYRQIQVDELVRQLGRLPLALELVGGYPLTQAFVQSTVRWPNALEHSETAKSSERQADRGFQAT